MTTNNTTLIEAFTQALNNMPKLVTDEKAQIPLRNGTTKTYEFMSLATLLEKIRPILAQHSIAITQSITSDTLKTYVIGHGEQLLLSSYPLKFAGGPQENGSEITYARRYSLYATLGLMPEKDDDGAVAQQQWRTSRQQQQQQQQQRQQWRTSQQQQQQQH